MTPADFKAAGATDRVIEAVEAARLLLDTFSTLIVAIGEERQQLPADVADDDPRLLALNSEFESVEFLMKRVTQSLSMYHETICTSHSHWIARQAAVKECS